jgi:ABC-type bacteriocin/lantibiotic exporter with double-glycine peptidase domain
MNFLRYWLAGTFAAIALALIWAYAPILLAIFLVTAALALLTFAIVAAARAVERRRGTRQ